MFFLFIFALFATCCLSHSIFPLLSRSIAESLLAVHLYHTDGFAIKATISNRGNTDLRILKPGSILDAKTFSKFHITHDGIPVPFNGPVPNFVMNKWTSEHFVTILAGQTTESIIDLSTTYELSSGEKYSVAVNSIVHHAQPDSNDIVASIPYQTNTISLDIPQDIAQRSAIGPKLQKRVRYFPDCSPQQLSNLTRASFLGSTWAGAGALEALKKNSPVWQRYFRINASTEGATTEMLTKFHSVVSIRLANVAFELSSGLVSEIHCQSDINTPSQFQQGNFDLCAVYPGQAIAYTIRPTCQIALCPLYWKLENNNADCMSAGMKGGFEQTGILIHELTHCNTIGQVGVQPSTDDLAYDFDDTINDEFVTAGTSVQNAQSHALFAKGMWYIL